MKEYRELDRGIRREDLVMYIGESCFYLKYGDVIKLTREIFDGEYENTL